MYVLISAMCSDGPNGNIAVDDITLRFGACIETTTVSADVDVTTASDDHDDYEVGDVVFSCDFDNSVRNGGSFTGCPGIDHSEISQVQFLLASASDSADTGPTADHTGDGGTYHNGSGSSGEKNRCVVMFWTHTGDTRQIFKNTVFSKKKLINKKNIKSKQKL